MALIVPGLAAHSVPAAKALSLLSVWMWKSAPALRRQRRVPRVGQRAALAGRIHFKGRVKDGALSRCHLTCDGTKQALFCLLDADQRSGDSPGRGNANRESPARGLPSQVNMIMRPSSQSWE